MKLIILAVACVCVAVVAGEVLNRYDDEKYADCKDLRKRGGYLEAGVYLVHLNASSPLQVKCRFDLNATYTAIMIQKYGRVNFRRTYHDYEFGFGAASQGDFWMGLHYMKFLSDKGNHILTVTLQDWGNVIRTIQYNSFGLGPPEDRYRLYIGSYVSSSILPDDFSFNTGMQFATYDYPDYPHLCAQKMGAGWWYNYCSYTLPTGKYYQYGPYTPSGSMYDGIFYKDWHNYGYSLKYIKLEIS